MKTFIYTITSLLLQRCLIRIYNDGRHYRLFKITKVDFCHRRQDYLGVREHRRLGMQTAHSQSSQT